MNAKEYSRFFLRDQVQTQKHNGILPLKVEDMRRCAAGGDEMNGSFMSERSLGMVKPSKCRICQKVDKTVRGNIEKRSGSVKFFTYLLIKSTQLCRAGV